jgi:hypothetical protein
MNAERARRHVPPNRWMRISYDDLCADFQVCADKIVAFAGVESARIPENFFDLEHHIIGNSMRLRPTQRITKDESWKERLSAADLATIASVAGDANRYFGFSWP